MLKIKKFYSNKKVFITGHTGFKGSWLVSVLQEFGSKVTGYSLNDEKKRSYEKMVDFKKVNNIYGDVANFKKLKISILKFNPDIIFHLAAQPLVSISLDKPVETFKTNLLGSVNIMEIAKNCKNLKSLVIITSDKCYMNKELRRGYKEDDLLGGEDPYSASKAAAEIAFKAYSKSFFLKNNKFGAATARAGNVIGGGDWSKNRIIPDCIRAKLQKKKLIIRNPYATRPWQHVLEPISGYLLLAKNLYTNPKKYSGSWNFGPNNTESKSVIKVAKFILSQMKSNIKISIKKGKFKETKLLSLNCNKAKKILKWKQTWNFTKTLKQTVFWYSSFLKYKNARHITGKQIKEYFKKFSEA